MRCTLDDREVTFDAEPSSTTLDVLRDTLGCASVRAGCAPQGMCGCCAVLVDGRPRLGCTLPVRAIEGHVVTTSAGIPGRVREALTRAFAAEGAAQCGYCTAGVLVSASALLRDVPEPSREAVERALALHLCRCTGYAPIVAGILRAAATLRGEPDDAAVPDPDTARVAAGGRTFVDDLVRPGMLHGALVLADAAGQTLPDDLDAPAGGLHVTWAPVAEGRGVPLAAIAHPDPFVVRAWSARLAAACVESGQGSAPPVPDWAGVRARRVEGDVDAALAGSVVRVVREVDAPSTDVVPLEPEAALAVPEQGDDPACVYLPSADPAGDARALGGCRVVAVPSGGSYGARRGQVVGAAALALARRAGVPVRVSVPHEASPWLRPRRPGGSARAEVGLDAQARWVALDVHVRLDGGRACADADVIVAETLAAVPYAPAAVRVTVELVPGTGESTCAARGAGAVLAVAAVEQALDAAAASAAVEARDVRCAALPADIAGWLPADGHVAVARGAGLGAARVVVRRVPEGLEAQCNVPDEGTGRDAVLRRVLAAQAAEPRVTVAWALSDTVGEGAPAHAPVDVAAARAAAALCAGAIAACGEADASAPEGWAIARATLQDDGRIERIELVVTHGPDTDPAAAARLARGAAHMGVGLALTEGRPEREGTRDPRLRAAGLMKVRATPSIEVRAVPRGPSDHDVTWPACAATVAALCQAVAAFERTPRPHLPMRDSMAATSAGVRPSRREDP